LGLVRSTQHEDYDHFFIFPNLAIGVTRGSMMSVQTYEPLSPDRCHLRFRLRMAPSDSTRLSHGTISQAARGAVQNQIRHFNQTVLKEDQEICERVQEGIRQTTLSATLGLNESRITAFHQAWLARCHLTS
jgi:phenylpropionate dioxygenase-like ring-hydroxylating dioxygenase large terminal subunit